jgi:capsular exopolysaccharide synthesis family protein
MNQGQDILPSVALALQRRLFPATATFISVILGAVLYLLFAPRHYEGTAKLILNNKQTNVSQLGQDLTKNSNYVPGEYSPLADRAELIKSKAVLQRAIALVYGNSELDKETQPTVKELNKALKVKLIPATSILEIHYEHEDPQITAKLTNAVAEAMIEKSKQDIRSEAQSLREFLEFEVNRQQVKVKEAEASENEYREKNGLVSLDNQTDNLVNSINYLENQEHNLLAQIEQNRQQVTQLQQTINVDSSESAYIGGRVGQDKELQKLRSQLETLDAKIASSQTKLTDNNPVLISLKEERDEVAKLYQQKLNRVSGDRAIAPSNIAGDELSQDLVSKLVLVKTELTALEKKRSTITQEKQKLQQRLDLLPVKVQPLTELVRKRQENNNSLKFLQQKLEEARIAEAQLYSDLKIVEIAEVEDEPSSPNPPAVLALSFISASILSILLIVLLETIDNTLHSIAEVEEKLELPMLGAPPSLPADAVSLEYSNRFLYDPSLVEPYRVFLKNLESRTQGKLKMLVVSSTIPGEGKSVIASHLAAVSAMLGRKTLLIDADLRRPQQHTFFNLDFQSGVSDVIEGALSLETAVKPTNTHNLSILTCGQLPSLPSSVLDSLEMEDLLHKAQAAYDLVIIDTPPVSSCADAHSLCRHSDGLVMVIRPNVTPKDILMRAVSELRRNNVPIFGFVMNGTTPQTDKYYRYGYDNYSSMSQPMMLNPSETNNKEVRSS